MATKTYTTIDQRIPFWRNIKTLRILFQIGLLLLVVLLIWFMATNVNNRLVAAGRSLRINFFGSTAGFAIGEGLPFSPQETYGRAFIVGLVNTLRVAVLGIILATILGLFAGIARLSNNWLVSRIAAVYIDVIRSTPLLVQLFFWYFGVVLTLPNVDNAYGIPGLFALSNRGAVIAGLQFTGAGLPWRWWLLAALVAGAATTWWRGRMLRRAGRIGAGLDWGVGVLLLVAAIGYAITSVNATLPPNVAYTLERGDRGLLYADRNGNGQYDKETETALAFVPVTLLDASGEVLGTTRTNKNGSYRFYDLPDEAQGASLQWETPGVLALDGPVRRGFNFVGGHLMTPEFFGLVVGLVVYTGAFIAEIVRAGINAVSRGQWEAGRALGLKNSTILRRIVLPQALRVIVPPLTSQYLNLSKNSSLAIAIGYPDLFNVSLTILNQTGAEIQMFVVILVTYLAFSLITSLFMNWYNQRIALKGR